MPVGTAVGQRGSFRAPDCGSGHGTTNGNDVVLPGLRHLSGPPALEVTLASQDVATVHSARMRDRKGDVSADLGGPSR
jgi:hypothetical protein